MFDMKYLTFWFWFTFILVLWCGHDFLVAYHAHNVGKMWFEGILCAVNMFSCTAYLRLLR